ncbi:MULTISPECIES: oligopeptide ABC transporter permease [Brevibacillus]|uniref:oligopeptide ABC transporter permease n=1 Tax=Brevibacillus TaxID=55080 RepID=UPI000240460B|nr:MULTISPECIES: oligopeptide ABC transporter permease [Brevibacillus]MBA4534232.1 ABC transporter permease [Brevibacillus halotolerans]MCR8965845.1 ABC transporter permease [Brevibacillus laterosporus]MCZ0838000.1 ABC transporter permease [Brevibacillus halotolerans]CCF13183.1 binding--dependent transport system inner membrane component family protein [Brevibacillus laterosporus GI-9]
MEPVITPNSLEASAHQGKRQGTSPWAIGMRKFAKNKLAIASIIFLAVIFLICFSADFLTHYDPIKIDIRNINQAPSSEHWLGTDKGGRDVYTRLLYGGQISLTIGLSITLFVVIFGTLIGSVAGYFGGLVDNLLMRFTDFIITFPFLIFVIVLNSVFTASGVLTLITVVSVLSWGSTARMVRGKILAEKENEYVHSAISIGCTPAQVIIKHILPNVISTIIVQGVYLLASMIVVETGLSFLGFGVPSNVPSWGNIMSDAVSPEVIEQQWWIWLPAGACITLTILAINFVGEGLKDAFNPKSLR